MIWLMAKITDNTNAILKESDRLIKQKLELAVLLVERTAKENCPRLASRPPKNPKIPSTGTARRSITHEIALDGKSAKVGSNIEYFPYIEMGTKFFAAFAPLRRGLETNMGKIKRLFGAR